MSETVQLRFTAGTGLTSKLICAYTWAPYSHVEFVIPPNYFPDYPEGGYLGAHNDGGVQLRPFDYDKTLKRELFGDVVVTPEVRKTVMSFAHDQIGKPYDLSALFGIVIHEDITQRNKWFCSELICGAFISAYDPILNISKINRVYPSMVLISPRIQYSGGFPLYGMV